VRLCASVGHGAIRIARARHRGGAVSQSHGAPLDAVARGHARGNLHCDLFGDFSAASSIDCLDCAFCFAHGGGSFPGTLGRISHGRACRPDLFPAESHDPKDYLAGGANPPGFSSDSLVHDAGAMRLLLELFGSNRIALGSDYPFPLGEDRPGALIEEMKEELGNERVNDLLFRSAREFLNRPPKPPRLLHDSFAAARVEEFPRRSARARRIRAPLRCRGYPAFVPRAFSFPAHGGGRADVFRWQLTRVAAEVRARGG